MTKDLMVKEGYDLTKEVIRMEFDRIYAKAMASLAQSNDTAAKNYLNVAAGKLSGLLPLTGGEERESVQTWILDIGGQLGKGERKRCRLR